MKKTVEVSINDETSSEILEESIISREPINLRRWIPRLALTAFLDLTEQCLKNIALLVVATSIVNMLRSSVIFFTGNIAWIFLNKKLKLQQRFGALTIFVGLALVVLA